MTKGEITLHILLLKSGSYLIDLLLKGRQLMVAYNIQISVFAS